MEQKAQIPGPDQLAELEQLAIDVATRCGCLIMDERPGALGVAATKSSDTDVVTVMDRRSEALASQLLSQRRPDDGQFGEEGLSKTGTSGIIWVVDPIDGTVNYLYELPSFCVSVAAVIGDPSVPGQWRPVAGAVMNPVNGELFSAHHMGGARRFQDGADHVLHRRSTNDLAQALVSTGFSYSPEVRAEQGQVLARLLPHVRDIRRMGSAALDICHVASGNLDVHYERCLNPWDLAAAWIIATEAGLSVRGPGGGDPDARLTMVGSDVLLDQLAALVDVDSPR